MKIQNIKINILISQMNYNKKKINKKLLKNIY